MFSDSVSYLSLPYSIDKVGLGLILLITNDYE